jgi:predicted NAD-dependent protein-ADP-ribosyltransferase YbiA (DUF1768 family)
MSLAEILQSSCSRVGYDLLFTSERGFLRYDENKKRWSLTRAQPRDLSVYYSDIVERLVNLDSCDDIPDVTLLVQRVNELWLRARGEGSFTPPTSSERYVYFNSRHQKYSCFSNFYPTLVVFTDPLNPSTSRLYPSSENAYQAHKTVKIRQDLLSDENHTRHSFEMYGMPDDDDEFVELLSRISTADPVESRAISKFNVEKSDDLARYKASIMKDILRKKFSCNLPLHQWLMATKAIPIVEDTSEPFWGAKDPSDPELMKSYRLPISQRSRNVVGRILMEIRNEWNHV